MTTAHIQAIQTDGHGTRTVLHSAPLTGRGMAKINRILDKARAEYRKQTSGYEPLGINRLSFRVRIVDADGSAATEPDVDSGRPVEIDPFEFDYPEDRETWAEFAARWTR